MERSPLQVTVPLVMFAILETASGSVSAQAAPEPSPGKVLFESRCAACHSLDASRVGPMLRAVVGRRIASVAGYDYSDALKRVKGQWDGQRLEKWLQDPQRVAPGTKMSFSLASAADRQAVVQYLSSVGAPIGGAAK